uniref:Uncharacterized protein n=1 Tax=Eptatretus burgeri TaxID=7764 RepID=A0A8C4R6A5_EPTBU
MINSECYCDLILYPFIKQLKEDEISSAYFQQASATAHTARGSMTLLCNAFADRLISKDIWPPRSLDLSPPDFYLWGAMKGAVYKDNPHSLQELQEVNTKFINNISQAELMRAFKEYAGTCRCLSACTSLPFSTHFVKPAGFHDGCKQHRDRSGSPQGLRRAPEAVSMVNLVTAVSRCSDCVAQHVVSCPSCLVGS